MFLALTCNTVSLLGGGQVIKKLLKGQSALVLMAKVLTRTGMLVFHAEMEATLSEGKTITERLTGSVFFSEVADFIPTWYVHKF